MTELLSCVVIEDEWATRDYLVELIEQTGLAACAAAFADTRAARTFLSAHPAVDVLFVDVQLPGQDGLEFIRSLKEGPALVLATARSEYAMEGFELGVSDYLLKPFSQSRVLACLERQVRRKETRLSVPPSHPMRIAARSRNGIVLLGLEQVWAFESEERMVHVHSTAGRFEIDISLNLLEQGFASLIRVHRSWLINEGAIREIIRRDGEASAMDRA